VVCGDGNSPEDLEAEPGLMRTGKLGKYKVAYLVKIITSINSGLYNRYFNTVVLT